MKQSITLYHISMDLSNDKRKVFQPRIPKNTINAEDETIPRICLSDCIVSAVNSSGKLSRSDDGSWIPIYLYIWKAELSLSDPYLITWKTLYDKNMVPDAAAYHEYWYTKELEMQGYTAYIRNAKWKDFYTVAPKYKSTILGIVAPYVKQEELEDIKKSDPCSILNQWLPQQSQSTQERIIAKVKESVVVIRRPSRQGHASYEAMFNEILEDEVIPEWDCTNYCYDFELQII